jgi:4-amino-4-deoxy-L-arabinose transferase-like glycosyltransferase
MTKPRNDIKDRRKCPMLADPIGQHTTIPKLPQMPRGLEVRAARSNPTCYTAWMLRRLRIAASVFFVAISVAIAALWARSCWNVDQITHDNGSGVMYSVSSYQGMVQLFNFYEWPNPPGPSSWNVVARPVENDINIPRFTWSVTSPQKAFVAVPHWFLLTGSTIAAVLCLPLFSLRFSMRTAFIAITLVALGMGGIAIALR